MINQYEIIKNKETNKIELKSIRQIDFNQERQYDAEDCVDFLNMYYYLDKCDSEHVYLVAFGYNKDIIGLYCVAIGDYEKCDVYNRTINIFLSTIGATEFMLFHNHPDGSLQASDEDRSCSTQLELLGNLIGIKFNGSYVISSRGWKEV